MTLCNNALIGGFKMYEQNIIELLLSIEKQPRLYFGDDYSLMDLRHFCTGYMLCLRDLGITDVHILAAFNNYIARYYGDYLTLDECSYVIRKTESKDAAFRKYFELFHSFLEQNQLNQSSIKQGTVFPE